MLLEVKQKVAIHEISENSVPLIFGELLEHWDTITREGESSIVIPYVVEMHLNPSSDFRVEDEILVEVFDNSKELGQQVTVVVF